MGIIAPPPHIISERYDEIMISSYLSEIMWGGGAMMPMLVKEE